jgi:hypothetical protein
VTHILTPGCFCIDGQSWFAVAVGVANNPDSIPAVRGIDGTSRNNKRLAGVTEGLQVRKAAVEFHVDETSNVLANDPSGPDSRNDSAHLRPEISVVFRATSLPGVAEWLAGESSDDDVGDPGGGLKRSYVVMNRHPRKVLRQHLSAPRFDLAKLHRAESASHLKAEAESADAAEQVEDSHARSLASRSRCSVG